MQERHALVNFVIMRVRQEQNRVVKSVVNYFEKVLRFERLSHKWLGMMTQCIYVHKTVLQQTTFEHKTKEIVHSLMSRTFGFQR